MHLSSVSKNTEQVEYQNRSQSEILYSEKFGNANLNFLSGFEDTRSKPVKLIPDCSNLHLGKTKTRLYNYKKKPFIKPILQITVSLKNPVRRLAKTCTKQEYYKKVETTISNQDNCLQHLQLHSIKEKKRQKIYEIKKSESDILDYKSITKYAAYKCADLNFLRMENNNRKDIKTTRIKRTNNDCNCEDGNYKIENDRKNRVTIVGQLGLTQDERYVLKCAATVNDKPISTNFSETLKKPDPLLKQNIFNDAETQATQADFNLSQKNKKSYKNRFVQCDCSGGKVDAAVSRANVLNECNSPLVIISVYPRQGETEDADYCPVKIVQHQNFSANKVKTIFETENVKDNAKQKRDRTLSYNKKDRLTTSRSPSPVNKTEKTFSRSHSPVNKAKKTYSRSPSPVNKTENTYTDRNKHSKAFGISDVSRRRSPENKNYKIANKPNEIKKDVFRVNEQNKYNKNPYSLKQQSNKFERKDPRADAEQVKKALVNNFLRNIDKVDKHQPKTKVIKPKDDASKITINIDGDNENYDVMFERNDFDTGVTIRKSAKHKNRNQEIADINSMQNYLTLSDDIEEASYSRKPDYRRNVNLSTDSRLNVRDSLEINHRRGQKHPISKNKNGAANKLQCNDYAPLKHFRGDNCSLTDPITRDREIRELLGVLRDSKKYNITSDKQDKDNCLKTCYESLLTGHRIGTLFDVNVNKNIYENLNNLVPIKKEENIKTAPKHSSLTKPFFDTTFYTNSVIVPKNLILSRNIQVFLQFDHINKIRPIILTSKQYQKIKRNVQCTVSKKISTDRKSRYFTNSNDVFIGDIKVKPKVNQTLHFDREVQTERSDIEKIAKHEKRKYHQNMRVFNEILNKSNSAKYIHKALVSECKHTKQTYFANNDNRHVVSSVDVGCRNNTHMEFVTSPTHVMDDDKKSLYSFGQQNSIRTIFKGHRRSVTPNLGTSAISLDSGKTRTNNSVKPGDCKTKKPFLRRLISCLVMRSTQSSVIKAGIPGKERVRLSNSVDSYHINTSLGAFEMSSSLFDTSVSFYSNHTTMPLNKIKRGLFTSVREFLTGRKA